MSTVVSSGVQLNPKVFEVGAAHGLSREDTIFVCGKLLESFYNIDEAADACKRQLLSKSFSGSFPLMRKAMNDIALAMN